MKLGLTNLLVEAEPLTSSEGPAKNPRNRRPSRLHTAYMVGAWVMLVHTTSTATEPMLRNTSQAVSVADAVFDTGSPWRGAEIFHSWRNRARVHAVACRTLRCGTWSPRGSRDHHIGGGQVRTLNAFPPRFSPAPSRCSAYHHHTSTKCLPRHLGLDNVAANLKAGRLFELKRLLMSLS
jgi:hypothetical protein